MSEKADQLYVSMKQWNALLKEVQTLRVQMEYQTNTVNSVWQRTEIAREGSVLQGIYYQVLKLEQEILLLKQMIMNMTE
ncbi:hypothetical protein P4377_24935 [Bacillus thuringiensis]|nr:hypothetical protein [Bacillus thuringiensis]